MENQEKVGMTLLNWILSILGIILLIILIAIPPIFRVVFEEEPVIENKPSNEVEEIKPSEQNKIDDTKYTKITCIKQTTHTEYIENTILILAHDNEQLKVLTEDITHTYLLDSKDSESMYTEEKLACKNKPEYDSITGFNYSCNTTNDSIETTKKYDLNTFRNTTDQLISEVNPSFILNQNITEITTSLISEGYTCN